MSRLLLAAVASCLVLSSARAEDWPGWRGPRGDGTSAEKGVPLDFGPDKNVRWRAPIAGNGYSSPIIVGDRVFVTTCLEKDDQRVLLCLDRRTGKERWSRVVLTSLLEKKHGLNSYASATPACDGERVYVAFLKAPVKGVIDRKNPPEIVLACYDVDGKELWRKVPGKHLSVHGFCSSPVLHKGLVILNADQDSDGYLVAFDRKTGEEKWRTARPYRTRSYCVPLLIPDPTRKGVTQLVLSGSKSVTGYDADTGKLLWIHDGPTEQYVASLVYHQGILFLTTGYPQYHLMGIRPTGEGKINETKHVVWHIPHEENGPRGASYVPSPLAHDGHFYVVSDPGYLGCIEAQTGKRLWLKQLGRRHSASPILVDGHLIIPDDDGKVWVVKASPKFEVVRTIPFKEETYASPATAQGELFLRTKKALYCISNKKEASASR